MRGFQLVLTVKLAVSCDQSELAQGPHCGGSTTGLQQNMETSPVIQTPIQATVHLESESDERFAIGLFVDPAPAKETKHARIAQTQVQASAGSSAVFATSFV